jgi:hypothetical protein
MGTSPQAKYSKRQMRLDGKGISSAVISIVAVACFSMSAAATERYWIAHEARLIVVGTFQPERGFWWLDGWHETGTIRVSEVLYGRAPGEHISFRLTIRCYMPWWNRWRPSHFMNQFTEIGLWFLRPLGDQIWEPANGCDSGYRRLSDRGDFERYIRTQKP